MASIRTAGLTQNFGDLRAVNEIDLDLPEGGLAGFVGPNGTVAELFAEAGEKSRALATHYQREADLRGCAFLDAGQIIGSSERDGIHFEVEAHQTLGRAVARIVQELLGA